MRDALSSRPPSVMERRARVNVLVACTFMIVGVFMANYVLKNNRIEGIFLGANVFEKLLLIGGFFFAFMGISLLLMLYLRGEFEFLPDWVGRIIPFSSIFSDSYRIMGRLSVSERRDELRELSNKVAELKKAQLTSATDGKDVVEALLPLVQSGVGELLEQKFAAQAQDFDKLSEIRDVFQKASARLHLELDSLRNRGNLNLVIGTLTTTVAIVLLTYMVLGSARTFADATDLLAHYVPRVTIVVFIEIFAFFFLKLYRDTLHEMRTYQDDLTRLQIQQVALEAAWTDEAQSARKGFAEVLIRADQSSPSRMGLKKDEVNLKEIGSLVEKLSKLLPNKASGK